MRKFILITVSLLYSVVASAQTQQGFVKTKGRMVNGQHVPGKGLPGATVAFSGGRNVAVQKNDGSFSFPVPSKTFMVQSVQKKGYELVDVDVTKKSYQHSSNPLYLLMETPEQQIRDLSNAQEKISKILKEQLNNAITEIQRLKGKNKISEEEYSRRIAQLMQDQQNNQKLIADMAKEYAQMDYDQMDKMNRQISNAILNGELTKADSLLRSKGDMRERIAKIRMEQQIEVTEEEMLSQRQRNLEKSKAFTKKKMEEITSDCYKYYDRFCLTQQYDSAAFYLNMRAELDTTNVLYLLETIDFEKEFISDGWEKKKYERALSISLKLYGEQSWEYALCCNRIGNEISEESYKTADFAEDYLDTAHGIIDSIYGDNHLEMARCYLSYGKMYLSESRGIYSNNSDWEEDVELAKDYFIKAANIFKRVNPTGLLDIAKCYMLLYDVCGDEEYNEMAFNIYKSINKGQNAGTALYYYQKGMNYYEDENLYTPSLYGYWFENISKFDDHTAIRKEIRNYKKSIPLLRKAQDIYVKVYGINYPMVDEIDYIIDQIEAEIHIFNQALNYKEPIQVLYDLWNQR